MDKPNHYSALNCDESASKEELRKQYKILALKTHPDKSDSSESHREFHRIDSAIKVLSDDKTRRQYDSQLIESRSENRIINDEMRLEDLTLDSETKTYWSDCRCGGSYTVLESELATGGCDQYLIVDCNSCSLSVKLILS